MSIRDGRIAALGDMTQCPEDPETFDAQGGGLYPGFVDAHTHLGMWEDGLGFEGDDGNEDTDPCMPQLRGVDAVNPLDRCFREALEAGVTTVVTGPGSANPIGGQLCAMKTYGCAEDGQCRVHRRRAGGCAGGDEDGAGENPKSSYHEKNQTPVTRMATASLIREQLARADGTIRTSAGRRRMTRWTSRNMTAAWRPCCP